MSHLEFGKNSTKLLEILHKSTNFIVVNKPYDVGKVLFYLQYHKNLP